MNANLVFGSSWGPRLKSFMLSHDFKSILKTIKEQSCQPGTVILPKADKIFRPFRDCPFEHVKVVFLGMNPYYESMIDAEPNGLLFGSDTTHIPWLQRLIYAGVEVNYDKKGSWDTNNLNSWAKQGVLLLPLDLTMVQGQRGAHLGLWEPFIRAVFEALSNHSNGIIYVLLGSQAAQYAELIDPLQNDMVLMEHPAKALAMRRNWKTKNVFNYIDRVTNMIHGKKINWYGKA